MSKRDMLKTLDNSSYTSLIIGAILVFIFEFTANLLLLKLSIILFGAAFLILCVLSSLKLVFIKNEAKEKNQSLNILDFLKEHF